MYGGSLSDCGSAPTARFSLSLALRLRQAQPAPDHLLLNLHPGLAGWTLPAVFRYPQVGPLDELDLMAGIATRLRALQCLGNAARLQDLHRPAGQPAGKVLPASRQAGFLCLGQSPM